MALRLLCIAAATAAASDTFSSTDYVEDNIELLQIDIQKGQLSTVTKQRQPDGNKQNETSGDEATHSGEKETAAEKTTQEADAAISAPAGQDAAADKPFQVGQRVEIQQDLNVSISKALKSGEVGRVIGYDDEGDIIVHIDGEHVTIETQDFRHIKKKVFNETEVPHSAADAQGISQNAAGDLNAFLSALGCTVAGMVFCIIVFMYLRKEYKLTFFNNVLIGVAPSVEGIDLGPDSEDAQTMWSLAWSRAAQQVTVDNSAKSIGLDNALLLHLADMGMYMMGWIGLPMVCIMGVANCSFGGKAAGDDYLSYLSFGNVENGSSLYWVHAFVIWFVVVFATRTVTSYNDKFLELRREWLTTLPAVRAKTILVEGLPGAEGANYRSDSALRKFFNDQLGSNKVESVWVTKDTGNVQEALAQFKDIGAQIADERRHGKEPSAELQDQFRAKRSKVLEEQDNLRKATSESPGDKNLSTAFVTFQTRKDAEIAKTILWDRNTDNWQISEAVDVEDVEWKVMSMSESGKGTMTVIGYLLVVALYFAYMPLVIGVTNVAVAVDLGPYLQPIWEGLAPTVGLQFMVAFLPTFLILIFQFCFPLVAAAHAQHKLQIWYFWFQVVFVVLVTAIGPSVMIFTETLFTDPFGIFALLSEALPYATHFYMNFLVLQWLTHCMNLMRYVPLSKFIALSKVSDSEERARELSEPEDQDFYGLGARNARFTINLVIGLVYGTLSPPINILTFINFYVCRNVYGYLVNFAEMKKPDLGGVFWVSSCKHLHVGLALYSVVMTGVLYGRAANGYPALISAPTLLYVLWKSHRYNTANHWESLAFPELHEAVTGPSSSSKQLSVDSKDPVYMQPEMRAAICDLK